MFSGFKYIELSRSFGQQRECFLCTYSHMDQILMILGQIQQAIQYAPGSPNSVNDSEIPNYTISNDEWFRVVLFFIAIAVILSIFIFLRFRKFVEFYQAFSAGLETVYSRSLFARFNPARGTMLQSHFSQICLSALYIFLLLFHLCIHIFVFPFFIMGSMCGL